MNTIIIGAYWGDEGKGKIVDILAKDANWVARYNGGDNAGHTIKAQGKRIVLHILPTGVLYGKNVLLGPDVFLNPKTFFADWEHVEEQGFKITGRVVIDPRTHIIMPYHIDLDSKRESGDNTIGTTKRGIGPVAKDKANRTTDITAYDLVSDKFPEKLLRVIKEKKAELIGAGIIKEGEEESYSNKIVEEYKQYATKIKDFIANSVYILNSEENILMEGAQGALLDVVHGTRPYITASNTTAGGVVANCAIDPRKFKTIGIVKAYPSRVGEGPFPTELGEYEKVKNESKDPITEEEKLKANEGDEELIGKWIRQDGHEYGSTTGRPRRTGMPDFVALKYSALINNVDEWAITKLDCLCSKKLRAAIAYEKNSEKTEEFPYDLENYKPVYSDKEYYWEDISEEDAARISSEGYDSLPQGIKEYIKDLVKFTNIPVSIISLNPKREITLTKDVLERTKGYLNE